MSSGASRGLVRILALTACASLPFAGTAASAAGAENHGRGTVVVPTSKTVPTKVSGFTTRPATMRAGGELTSAVHVAPKGVRVVSLQYQRGGRGAFKALWTGRTSPAGTVEARIHPPTAGTWKVRLVVAKTAKASAFSSKPRTVTVAGVAATTKFAAFDASATTIALGTTMTPTATLAPRGVRTVELQTRAPTAAAFVVSTRGQSTAAGAFASLFRPAVPGVWQYRLVVRASATAKAATSSVRSITVALPVVTPPTAVPPVASLLGMKGETALKATADYDIGFDAAKSGRGTGSAIVVAVLDFGDGSTTQSFTGAPANWQTWHAYLATGTKTAKLTVMNTAGGSATASIAVTVFSAPMLAVSVPSTVVANTPTDFSIFVSAPAGTTVNYYDLWFWDDDTDVTGTSPPPTITHVFTTPGVKGFELDVCTDANGCSWTYGSVTVTPDKTTANLQVRDVATAGTSTWFSMWRSYAGPNATLTGAVLDLVDENNTKSSHPFTAAELSDGEAVLAFPTAGIWTVTLTVTDSVKTSATATATVHVFDAPVVNLTGPAGVIHVGQPVAFATSVTLAPGRGLDWYSVDGTDVVDSYQSGTLLPASVLHIFQAAGTYNVTLWVSDDIGGEVSTTLSVVVVD